MRGLDYYSKIVFEWTTTELGSQDAICAGGRYDGLVEQLGGKFCEGVGFAIGLERTVLLAEKLEIVPENFFINSDVFVVCDESVWSHGILVLEELRSKCPGLRITFNCGGGSLKSQMKKADRSGSRVALIVGDDEMLSNSVSLKYLRENKEQELVDVKVLPGILDSIFSIGGD